MPTANAVPLLVDRFSPTTNHALVCNAVLVSCAGHPFWLKVATLLPHHHLLNGTRPWSQVLDELVRRNSREDMADAGVRAPQLFGAARPVTKCAIAFNSRQVLKLTGPVLVQEVLHANGLVLSRGVPNLLRTNQCECERAQPTN